MLIYLALSGLKRKVLIFVPDFPPLIIQGFNMQQKNIGSGLQNLGNTCFFNATLQSLLYAPPLALLFQNRRHSQQCRKKNSNEWCVFCEIQAIYNNSRQVRIFSPNNMIKNLSKIFKKFKLGRQEDSHEFLRYLIEGMQESETGKLGKEREENEKKIKKTKVFDIFGGIIKTVVECLNCNHKSITTERYYDFNIGQECQRANSLHEGIASFFAVDKLEGSNKYLCENCKIRSNARKRFLIESIPQVATFQLKRFTNNMRKIGKYMQYPLEVDLGKYLQKPKKVVMKLFAVIVHLGGSSFSGHYYAFVRQDNLWFKMDDSYVSKCNLETVLGQQAYILFYQRQQLEEEKIAVMQVEQKVSNLKITEQINKVEQQKVKSKQMEVEVEKMPKKVEQPQKSEKAPILNGVGGKGKKPIIAFKQQNIPSKPLEVEKEEKPLQSKKQIQEPSQPLLQNIQNLLVHKLSEADVFKNMETDNQAISDMISKVVKEVIMEVSPQKGLQQRHQTQNSKGDESMQIELPSLFRRKSKGELEREMPYQELIIRTFQRILDLRSKMPSTRPLNYSRRSIYNLRDYQTVMQKRRKIG